MNYYYYKDYFVSLFLWKMYGLQTALSILSEIRSWNIKSLNDIKVYDTLTPAFLVTLASFVNQGLISKGEIKTLPEVYTYLSRCNFNHIIWISWVTSNYTWNSENLVEITAITQKEQTFWWNIDEICAKLFVKSKNLKKDDEDSIRFLNNLDNTLLLALTEIMDNIWVHSEANLSQKACLYMLQHYPSKNRTHLAVIDNWIWIIKSMKNSWYFENDKKDEYYLNLAMQRKITSWKGAWNWLFLVSEIVKETDSKLEICTWNILFKQNWQNKEIKYNSFEFPWTLININFNMELIDNKEREWLSSINKLNGEITDYAFYDNIFE